MSGSPMIVAGVMSGTSADGINVALVEIGERRARKRSMADAGNRGAHPLPAVRLIGQAEYPYPVRIRAAVLAAMNAEQARVADLARLNSLLGELYAEAVLETGRRWRVKLNLVGCHGQTLYHQGDARMHLGRRVSTTWQAGEAAIIAARLGVPVVSDFRPADMAVGGKGAPLVPYLDYLWFRDPKLGRIVQNIGGIANLTAIPAAASPNQVMAFDTGPGNMVIDAVTQQLFGRAFDRDGKIARAGEVIEPVLRAILGKNFFRRMPPKTAGREEFGREFVARFLESCGRARKQDAVRTATALTARSIAQAVERFVVGRTSGLPKLRGKGGTSRPALFHEMIVSGGGAKNSTLISMLASELGPRGIAIRFSDEFGLPSQAKEAVAFAMLAYQTWNRRPSNLPSATGAQRAAVLGKISHG